MKKHTHGRRTMERVTVKRKRRAEKHAQRALERQNTSIVGYITIGARPVG